jgi:hypothetical protein
MKLSNLFAITICLLKSQNQENKIFSMIDDGCGAAITQDHSFGCGTYIRGQLESNVNTAEFLKRQNEVAMAEEVYRITLDHIPSQTDSDIACKAISGYKDY